MLTSPSGGVCTRSVKALETVSSRQFSDGALANYRPIDRYRVSPTKEKAPEPQEIQGLDMVAGARYAHQKRIFPPVEVIDIQFEYQGKALVPVGA